MIAYHLASDEINFEIHGGRLPVTSAAYEDFLDLLMLTRKVVLIL